ncbi:L-serine ammonia-lyase, iron-sulfur-dependent subunit beta [Clostridium sediminicola]|uniref:L-serine ammonia-lyase, iron-sulfur-dependent subunit beta n=1 Tax=Clostridium sediminicola TaxID=3114879 RepID=UPI0031F1C564
MSNLSVFDSIGPIMVGPSSSHTAGAVRIGKLAKKIVGRKIKEVKIYLHGSFEKTYIGHGTDKALIAGLLGLSTDNELIKDSLRLASEENLNYEFLPINISDAHPNTVRLKIKDIDDRETVITASSIGGGNIVVTEVDGIKVDLTGKYFTLISIHNDKPGMIAKITNILQIFDVNIAVMKLARQNKGASATAIIELDQELSENAIDLIRDIPEIESVRIVNPIR